MISSETPDKLSQIIQDTMTQYWLSPDGQLYWIDYSNTADFVDLKEGDEEDCQTQREDT